MFSAHVAKAGVPMGVTVDRLDDRGDGVDVVFSDGSSGRYDMVVGCDGIRSRVRALSFPGVEPEFAGFCNWRMILPGPDAVDGPVWMWGRGKTAGVLPVDETRIYVAGVGKAENAERPPQDAVAGTFRRKFSCFGGPLPETLKLEFGVDDILYTVMEAVKLLPLWHKGRVVVMGDAAHAACPFWAEGGAMGIEDAVVLAMEVEARDDADAATRPGSNASTNGQAAVSSDLQ